MGNQQLSRLKTSPLDNNRTSNNMSTKTNTAGSNQNASPPNSNDLDSIGENPLVQSSTTITLPLTNSHESETVLNGGLNEGEEGHKDNAGEMNEETKERIFTKLFRLHFLAAIFFLAQTIGFSVSLQSDKIGSTYVTPSTTFATNRATPGPIGDPSLQIYWNGQFNPLIFIILFVALAAVDHGLTCLIAYLKPELTKEYLFEKKNNPLRWIEYSFSASFMLLSICILCGISDVHMWLVIFLANGAGMLCGQMLEMLSSPKNANPSNNNNQCIINFLFSIATALIFVPWLVPMCYFFRGAKQLADSPSDENLPSFVYVAVLGTLVCFSTFGINSFCYHILHRYDFHTAEFIYVLLSFTAKFLLATDVFGGISASAE